MASKQITSEVLRVLGSPYYFLEKYSESDVNHQIEDMLNALSIEYIQYPSCWACYHIDDDSDSYSSFNVLIQNKKIYIERTDYEITEFRNVLIKISKYLKQMGIEINNFHNLNILNACMSYEQANILSIEDKTYYENELTRSSILVDTRDITIAYTEAYNIIEHSGILFSFK